MRRALLEESLPRKLAQVLSDLDVLTVHEVGWAGRTNGELLDLAQEGFDVLFTDDKNLRFQQNVARYDINVVVAAGRGTKLEDILPLVPAFRSAIERIEPGNVEEVDEA